MNSNKIRRFKRKHGDDPPLGLSEKVLVAGGRHGYGLGDMNQDSIDDGRDGSAMEARVSGVHGGGRSAASCSTLPRIRLFDDASKRSSASRSVGLKSLVSSSNPYRNQPKQRSSVTSFASLARASKLARTKAGPRRSASHIVCAISENLARETCIASIDAGSPIALIVTKQANGQTYAETLAYLEMLQPDEVLLNEGRRNSPLAKKVLQLCKMDQNLKLPFENGQTRVATSGSQLCATESSSQPTTAAGPCTMSTVVKFISRAYFDQTKGAELLRRVVRRETYDASCSDEYILLSSSYALLHYTQQCLGATFAKNSIHLTLNSGGTNRMTIDRATVFQLELLANARTGKTKHSLIGTLDHTKTTVGGRLLRTSIMSPPTRVDTINARLDLVEAFLQNQEFFFTVLEYLTTLPDIDKMLSNIALVPRKKSKKNDALEEESETVTDRVANKGISALVCVKSTLGSLPAFANALEDHLHQLEEQSGGKGVDQPAGRDRFDTSGSPDTSRRSLRIGLGNTGPSMANPQRHQLLRAIIATMRQPKLVEVLKLVTDIFTDSTSFSRNAIAMRHHVCFALKAESNSLMEVCRRNFLNNVDDIYRLADEYAEAHNMHVSVKHTTARGYFLSIPLDYGTDLPQIFLQPAKCGKGIGCTTEEVNSLNLTAQENEQDLLLMTHEKIQEVLDLARSHYDAFAALSDAVAILDMCHSFADVVTLSRLPWCRPSVVDSSMRDDPEMVLAIGNGRYAIEGANSELPGSDGSRDFVPNDTYASRSKHFTVMTGINGSGKSTYLKQVAIIVLLAHCGSYVPAEEATIPIVERLCTRIGTTDDQEHNISTFLLEMKETAFICQYASPRSLILIDELGRATSNEDGVAIAWAVSEYLLKKGAITFFVTHYPQLCSLSNIYPSVQNQHLEANISEERDDTVLYTHRLSQGPCNLSSNYGVEMAESCGWPHEVLLEARRLRTRIEGKLVDGGISCSTLANGKAIEAKEKAERILRPVAAAIKQLASAEDDLADIRSKLDNLSKAINLDDETIARGIRDLLSNLVDVNIGADEEHRFALNDTEIAGSWSSSSASSRSTSTSAEDTGVSSDDENDSS